MDKVNLFINKIVELTGGTVTYEQVRGFGSLLIGVLVAGFFIKEIFGQDSEETVYEDEDGHRWRSWRE